MTGEVPEEEYFDSDDEENVADEDDCVNITEDEENGEKESIEKFKKPGALSVLSVELVNLDMSDIVIQGDWSVGLVSDKLKPVSLSSGARVVIVNVGTEEDEKLEKISIGTETGDNPIDADLIIKIDFGILSVTPPYKGAQMNATIES